MDELKVQLESGSGDVPGLGLGDKVSTARRRKEERYKEELRRMEREKKESQEVSIQPYMFSISLSFKFYHSTIKAELRLKDIVQVQCNFMFID